MLRALVPSDSAQCGAVVYCVAAVHRCHHHHHLTPTFTPAPAPCSPAPAPSHKHIHHRGFLIAQYCSSVPLLVLVLRSSHQIARHRTSEQCTRLEFEIKLRTAEYLEFTSTSPLHCTGHPHFRAFCATFSVTILKLV